MTTTLVRYPPGWRPPTWSPEKVAAVENHLKTDPARSDLLIAKLTDASKASVFRIRSAMEAEGLIPFINPRKRIGTVDDRLSIIKHKAKKAMNGNAHKSHILMGPGDRRGVKVPEGKLFSDMIREGLALEAERRKNNENINTQKIAMEVGLSHLTYAKGRLIVMLAENADLSADDKEVVQGALKTMDEIRSSVHAYKLVERIDKQVWGSGKKIHRNATNIKKHAEGFETNIEIITEICTRAAEAPIPAMNKESVLSAMEQLEEAMGMLRELYVNLGNLNRRKDND